MQIYAYFIYLWVVFPGHQETVPEVSNVLKIFLGHCINVPKFVFTFTSNLLSGFTQELQYGLL